MISGSQILFWIARFIGNEVDLDAFEDWFVHNTWNIHLSGSEAAERLTFEVEESLSEYSSNHISEQQLRSELSRILWEDTKIVEIADAPRVVFYVKSSSQTRPAVVAA